MVIVHVIDLVSAADTAQQGDAVYKRLTSAFSKSVDVVLSFSHIETATSSFVNAGLVRLLDEMSLADIKRRLKIVDSTRQINGMIRMRLTRESDTIAA